MKTLRLVRNIAVLFILAVSLLASRPSMGSTKDPKFICLFDSSTIGYNCTFNSDGTCSSSKCKAGEACNNAKCVDDTSLCSHKCCFCGFF